MMRKFSHVLMISAAMAVVVSAGSALADDGYGYVRDVGQDDTDRIAVIIDPRPDAVAICGEALSLYKIVIVSGGRATLDEIGLPPAIHVPAGTRFEIVSQQRCDSYLKLSLCAVQPQNTTPLLFQSTAAATVDHTGVITGQQDEDGFADLVLTSKGTKPIFATVWTDQWLEPADRIVDIIELDYDGETGIALYGGFLEY